MFLTRLGSKAVAESHFSFNSIAIYIRYLVNVYAAIDIKRDLWLTEREKDFFVATVIHVLHGITDPISDDAIQIYKKYFYKDVGKAKISDYINRLRTKDWIVYNKDYRIVTIPPFFEEIDTNEDIMDFKIRFAYEIDRHSVAENIEQSHDRWRPE